jgi:hypothetical protein
MSITMDQVSARSAQRTDNTEPPVIRECPMKIMAISTLIAMFCGNGALLAQFGVPETLDAPLPVFSMFIIAAMSGLAGTWINIAAFGADHLDAEKMARAGSVNFLLSSFLTPSVCWLIVMTSPLKIAICLALEIPVGLAIGIGGGYVLQKYGKKSIDKVAGKYFGDKNDSEDDSAK